VSATNQPEGKTVAVYLEKIVQRRAEDILPGTHIVNRGDVIDRARVGVFYTFTYVALSWDLSTGRAVTRTETLTLHAVDLVAVSV
jgi:hypothetical protein